MASRTVERQTTFGADARRSGEERPGARRRQGAVGVSSARLQMLQSQYNDGFGGSAAIATEDDAQRQAADTELTQLRTMIGSLQDSLADFQKK